MMTLPPTVLLVEDDRVLRDLIVLSLTRLNCRVVTAGDGAEALALAEEHRPDLVLLDILLPRMNGFEVMRQLNEAAGRPAPVIVISALGLREVVEKAARAGAADFIVKPFDPAVLAAKVQRTLEQAQDAAGDEDV